jgi:CubicO group peptidase (beta-lactamase class C family)
MLSCQQRKSTIAKQRNEIRRTTVRCAIYSARFALALVVLLGASFANAADLDPGRLKLIRAKMQEFVDQGELAGAVTLVGRHDGVASLEAVGYRDLDKKIPMQTDSLFRIASMTKPITAIAVMILAEEKKLSVDDPVEKYLPEFCNMRLKTGGAKERAEYKKPSRPILVRDLLTHTSGMHGGLPRMPADLYLKRDHTLAEAVPLYAKEPLEFEPGTKWSYCNVGIDTLGRIVEVVSGQSYESFLKSRVFDPLEMPDTCFYPTAEQKSRIALTYDRKDGKPVRSHADIIGLPPDAKFPIPAGGLYSTASDLARVYRMMLNQGELDGKRILSPAAVKEMTRVQTGELASGFTPGLGFGFGWGVVRQPQGVTAMLSPGTFGHGGAFGTQGWIDPQKDLILILLIQRIGLPNGDASPMRREFQSIAVSALEK